MDTLNGVAAWRRRRSPTHVGAVLWRTAVLASLLAAPLIAGCGQAEPWGTLVVNKTPSTVVVLSIGEAGDARDLGTIAPGLTLPLHPYFGVAASSCSRGTLVVRRGSATGPVITRRTEPLCYPDSWVITEQVGSSMQ
jgi:hypothetical protein